MTPGHKQKGIQHDTASISQNGKVKRRYRSVPQAHGPDDLEALLEFYRALPEEDRLFLRSDVTKRENVVRRFGRLDYETVFPVLALVKEKIIGIGTIFRAEFGWKRDLGEIRVVVAREYQRKGLGTILTRELFFHAIKPKLFKLQAEMMDTQKSAIAAFERLGFRTEAVLKKHVTDVTGQRRDLIIMTLDIEELWYLMEDFVKGTYFYVV
ncbi:MAG: GNAT family N-acetyltransferase [candidate division KSB1 bacterium]|nr:GNAT family N-acetyltransferase [candidate division KSB1 bacterium]